MAEANWFKKFIFRAFCVSPVSFAAGALLVAGLVIELPTWSGFMSGGPYVVARKSELDTARQWQTWAAARQTQLEKSEAENVRLTAAVNNRAAQMAWCKTHDELIASLWGDWKSLHNERREQMSRSSPIEPSSHLLEDIERDPLVNSVERAQDAVMSRIADLMAAERLACDFGGNSSAGHQ